MSAEHQLARLLLTQQVEHERQAMLRSVRLARRRVVARLALSDQVRRRPLRALATAFVAGMVLGRLVGSRRG